MGFVGRKDSDSLTNDLLFAKKNDRWLQVAPLIRPSSPRLAARLPSPLVRFAPLRRPFAPPPRRFSQCSAIHRNSQAAWEHDSQGLGTRFPRAGNTIPKGWEFDSQGLGIRFPAAGNFVLGVPENSPCAGTSSAGPWYIECRPLVHRVPAAGNSIAGYCCPVNRLYVLYQRRFHCDKPLSGDVDG